MSSTSFEDIAMKDKRYLARAVVMLYVEDSPNFHVYQPKGVLAQLGAPVLLRRRLRWWSSTPLRRASRRAVRAVGWYPGSDAWLGQPSAVHPRPLPEAVVVRHRRRFRVARGMLVAAGAVPCSSSSAPTPTSHWIRWKGHMRRV